MYRYLQDIYKEFISQKFHLDEDGYPCLYFNRKTCRFHRIIMNIVDPTPLAIMRSPICGKKMASVIYDKIMTKW